MTDMSGARLSSFSVNQGLPGHVSRTSEPELLHWAEQKTVSGNSDTPLVRIGALVFWAVVAALLFARIFVVDPAKLRPAASTDGASSSAFHLTSNPKL